MKNKSRSFLSLPLVVWNSQIKLSALPSSILAYFFLGKFSICLIIQVSLFLFFFPAAS